MEAEKQHMPADVPVQEGFVYQPVPAQQGFTQQPVPGQQGFAYQPSPAQQGFTHQPAPTQQGLTHQPVPAQQGFVYQPVPAQQGFVYQPVPDQQGFTHQPQVTHVANFGPEPDNYLIPSLLVCLCCCWPLGLAALIYSCQVGARYRAGDLAGAEQASATTKKLAIAGLICGIIILAIYIPLRMISESSGY